MGVLLADCLGDDLVRLRYIGVYLSVLRNSIKNVLSPNSKVIVYDLILLKEE